MIKDLWRCYGLGLRTLLGGMLLAVLSLLTVSAAINLALGADIPWLMAIGTQVVGALVSCIATLLVYRHLTDKRMIWGWPVAASAFASLLCWALFGSPLNDDVLSVFFVTTVFSATSTLYQYQLGARLVAIGSRS